MSEENIFYRQSIFIKVYWVGRLLNSTLRENSSGILNDRYQYNVSNNRIIGKEIEQLALIGTMPDETDEPTGVSIDEYADLLDKITRPITLDGAHILTRLPPPTALYGIEWTLLCLIESVHPGTEFIKYKGLIDECNSVEFRGILVQRLDNS